jgi:hypothetical protein
LNTKLKLNQYRNKKKIFHLLIKTPWISERL